jgi:hypothetical protein
MNVKRSPGAAVWGSCVVLDLKWAGYIGSTAFLALIEGRILRLEHGGGKMVLKWARARVGSFTGDLS